MTARWICLLICFWGFLLSPAALFAQDYTPPALFVTPKAVVIRRESVPQRPILVPMRKPGAVQDIPSSSPPSSEDGPITVYGRDTKTGTFKRLTPSVAPRVIQVDPLAPLPPEVPSAMPAVPPVDVTSMPIDERMLDQTYTPPDWNLNLLSQPDTSDGKIPTAATHTLPPPPPPPEGSVQISKGQHVILPFSEKLSDLDAEQKGRLDENVITPLQKNKKAKADILAFAAPAKDEPERDQRLALARGLAVWDYLTDKGVDPTRLSLQVMGKNTLQLPFDRVEILFK